MDDFELSINQLSASHLAGSCSTFHAIYKLPGWLTYERPSMEDHLKSGIGGEVTDQAIESVAPLRMTEGLELTVQRDHASPAAMEAHASASDSGGHHL